MGVVGVVGAVNAVNAVDAVDAVDAAGAGSSAGGLTTPEGGENDCGGANRASAAAPTSGAWWPEADRHDLETRR